MLKAPPPNDHKPVGSDELMRTLDEMYAHGQYARNGILDIIYPLPPLTTERESCSADMATAAKTILDTETLTSKSGSLE